MRHNRRGGVLLTDCSGTEEVMEGSRVYLHRGRSTEPLPFQSGDVLGMLVRQQRSADISPLVVEEAQPTGYRRDRNGVYETGFTTSPGSTITSYTPLLALTLCESSVLAGYIISSNMCGPTQVLMIQIQTQTAQKLNFQGK